MWLGLPHPSIASILWCVCTNPLTLWVSISYVVFMVMNTLEPMMQFATPLLPLHEMLVSTWEQLHFSFNHIQLLWSMSQHCVYQRWHSHLSQRCHCWPNASGFTSLILQNSRICCIGCSSSQGKELSQLTPHCSIPPLSNWSIWFLTQTCRCVFTRMC
jgi:hypothetical protein